MAVGLLWVVDAEGIRETLVWHLSLTTNFYQFQHGSAPVAAHLWYMGAQEQALLLLAVVMLWVPASKIPHLMWAGIATAFLCRVFVTWAAGGNLNAAVNLPLSHLDLICTGGLLAYYRSVARPVSNGWRIGWRVALGVSAAALVVSRVVVLRQYPTLFENVVMPTLACPVYAWLLARASDGFKGPTGAVLNHRVPVYFGTIAYGIYIYHMVAFIFFPALCRKLGYPLNYVVDKALGWTGWDPPDLVWGHWFAVAFWTVLSLVMAFLSYFLVEKPIASLKRYIPYLPPSAAPPAHAN